MKKLFLILVSVLVLGGCSVDDDISANGGGVSSGGDDMAITTYPNVVEASRTVVDGGYLVDYLYTVKSQLNYSNELLMLIKYIYIQCLKVSGISSNEDLYNEIKSRLISLSIVSINPSGNTRRKQDLSRLELLSDGRIKFEFRGLELNKTGDLWALGYTFAFVKGNTASSGSVDSDYGIDHICFGRFTIFEPSN